MIDISFKARPIAAYKSFKNTNVRDLVVYSLEPMDIPFLEMLRIQIGQNSKQKETMPIHQEILIAGLNSIINILKMRKTFEAEDKTVALLSVCNGKVTSIIQGNMPKIDFKQSKIFYSNRGKPNESEIDWLTINPPSDNQKLPKSASAAIVAEFYKYCLSLKPRVQSIYCRSEIPEKCQKSVAFYKKIGFRPVSTTYIDLQNTARPIDTSDLVTTDSYSLSNDCVLPLVVSRDSIKRVFNQIAKKFSRQSKGKQGSIDLSTIVTQQ